MVTSAPLEALDTKLKWVRRNLLVGDQETVAERLLPLLLRLM